MRLKEIKPGMAIHCKNDEEKKALLEEAERLGYLWNSRESPIDRTFCHGNTIHFHAENEFADFKHIAWSNKTEGVTEFSDLILPELSAGEAIKIFGEICKGSCQACPLYAVEPYEACRYVIDTERGKHIEEEKTDNVYIKEGNYTPTVKIHKMDLKKDWYDWFAHELFVESYYVEFFVPENTVTSEYKIDLR